MHALRPTATGMVILALVASLSVVVAARSTAADVMSGESATWVTLIDQSCAIEAVSPVQDGAIQRMRGARTICDVRFDDPRVSGTVTTTGNYDCHAEAGCVTWGQQEIVGPDGSWSGSFSGLIDAAFTERGVAVLTGMGRYEGLTFVVHGVGPLNQAPTAIGLIYVGEAPPQP
jgi:hypothetical protein